MMTNEKTTSICFTGHRDLSESETIYIKERLTALLKKLIKEKQLSVCYSGGALGFDTVAAETVLSLRESYPHLKLCLILPCRGQENAWNASQKAKYNLIKSKADEVRVLAPFFYNGCMQVRNREMLCNSDICIAYLRKGTSSGGSLNTVVQAVKLGVPVINIANTESEDQI